MASAAASCACDDGNENSDENECASTRSSSQYGRPRRTSHLMQPLKISLSGTSQIPALHLCWSRHQYRHAKSGRMHSPVTAMPSAFERPSNRRKRCSGRMIRSRSTRPSAAKVAAKGRGGGASADDDGGVGDAISSHDPENELGARAHTETIEGGFAKLPLLPGAMLGMAAEYQSTLLADTLYCLVGNMIAWVAFYAATYPLTLYDPKKGERIEKPTFAQRLDAADSVFSMPFFPLLMVLALHGTYELWAMGTLHARWHVQLPSTRWFQLLYVTRMATHVRRAAVCSAAARRAPPPPMLTPTACSRRADARAVGDAAARPEAAAADEHAPRAVGGLLLRR